MASLKRIGLATGAAEPFDSDSLRIWVNPAVTDSAGTVPADELDLLTDIATACREELEDELRRAVVAYQYTYSLDTDDFDLGDGTSRTEISLPMPPLLSVESVTFYDTQDTSSVVAATVYRVHTGENGRIALKYGQSWPTEPRDQDCMVIAYTAGYSVDATSVPAPIVVGIKELTKFRYQNRGEGLFVGSGGWRGEVPDEISKIYRRLGRYRVPVVA